LYKQRADDYRRDSDGIACLPPGPKAGISGLAFPMKIVQTPNLVVVLYEYDTIFRQIFTDGRALPEDPNPTWMGYSIGHWDGDTLVVTTAGYNDRTTLDLGGHPHTEALRITERFHRRDAGHIDLQVTLDDPKAYTRSWTLPVELVLMPDGELIEYFCDDNERDAAHLVGKSGEEVRVPREILAQYAGVYGTSAQPADIVVSLEEDRFTINTGGGGKIPLVAHAANSFTMEGTGVEFVKDAQGAVTAMIQHWVEGDRNFARRGREVDGDRDLHEIRIHPVEPLLDLHLVAHRPAGLVQPYAWLSEQADRVDHKRSGVRPLADGIPVPPVVRELLREIAAVCPDDAVALVILIQDDDFLWTLKNLRVAQLIKICAREAERITVIAGIVAQRGGHVAVTVERLVAVIGGLACRRERRLVYAVAGHGHRAVGLNARPWAVCRLPRTRNIVSRRGSRGLSSGQRVLDRIPPPINNRQICGGLYSASATTAAPPLPTTSASLSESNS